jgi:uncharacterized protein YbjT (DUF2867 family)
MASAPDMIQARTGPVVAVTGATGFLGRRLVRVLTEQGWTVRVLARRDVVDPAWTGLEPQLVIGDLAQAGALAALCQGAETVVHVAGLIKARDRAAFDRANVEGSRRVAQATKAAGARLILVSSLAAREPELSDYAGSKRGGEDAAREILGGDLTIVRPPAIYGPGDVETLRLFKMASESAFLPVLDPKARMAWIHVGRRRSADRGLGQNAAPRAAQLVRRPSGGLWLGRTHASRVQGGRRLAKAGPDPLGGDQDFGGVVEMGFIRHREGHNSHPGQGSGVASCRLGPI